MAKKREIKYSLDQFRRSTSRWDATLYFNDPKEGWIGASKSQTLWYNKQVNKEPPKPPSARSIKINQAKQYSKYFSSDTKIVGRQGHLEKWARPLSLRGGKNPNYDWRKVGYVNDKGVVRKTSSKQLWGSSINKGNKVSSKMGQLNGTKDWIKQLQIAIHQLAVQSENFRVAAGKRALKVFQNSFKYQHFYSGSAHHWEPLAEYTLKKRAKRGTGNRILKEYGDLYKSIKIDEHSNAMTTRIYTDIVPANISHHKRDSICYAGYHNEGKGTYGRKRNGQPGRKYIQRQFMGHSSYLNPFTDPFMKKIIKLYLFDSVFMIKKF